jgi:hypothetical protein
MARQLEPLLDPTCRAPVRSQLQEAEAETKTSGHARFLLVAMQSPCLSCLGEVPLRSAQRKWTPTALTGRNLLFSIRSVGIF